MPLYGSKGRGGRATPGRCTGEPVLLRDGVGVRGRGVLEFGAFNSWLTSLCSALRLSVFGPFVEFDGAGLVNDVEGLDDGAGFFGMMMDLCTGVVLSLSPIDEMTEFRKLIVSLTSRIILSVLVHSRGGNVHDSADRSRPHDVARMLRASRGRRELR